jgi:hypothetical protein
MASVLEMQGLPSGFVLGLGYLLRSSCKFLKMPSLLVFARNGRVCFTSL